MKTCAISAILKWKHLHFQSPLLHLIFLKALCCALYVNAEVTPFCYLLVFLPFLFLLFHLLLILQFKCIYTYAFKNSDLKIRHWCFITFLSKKTGKENDSMGNQVWVGVCFKSQFWQDWHNCEHRDIKKWKIKQYIITQT